MKQKQWRQIKTQPVKNVSNHEISQHLTWITEEMLKRNLDPLRVVLHTIDPHYDQSLRPEVKVNPDRPADASTGIFRVIYNEKNGKIRKVKSASVIAKDGYDAVNVFCSIGDNLFAEARGDIQVIGMECEYIPTNAIRKFQEDWLLHGEFTTPEGLARAALENLISELEVFREEPAPANLQGSFKDSEQ